MKNHVTLAPLVCSLLLTGVCFGQTTERVSVNPFGVQGNNTSSFPSISADGSVVAFQSYANNLVPGDTNGQQDIFVYDRTTGVTERVNVDSLGAQGNNWSSIPSISADGSVVAFQSDSNNLVPGDTNGVTDVFVHDRTTGATERVSVDSFGSQGDDWSQSPSISADGNVVAFWAKADNLVPGDSNGYLDVFVHDRTTGVTERVSVDSLGAQGNGGVYADMSASISADGRYVAFASYASNLVPGDGNSSPDVFVHDRTTGVTERVSVDSFGTEGNGLSEVPSISWDGNLVAFYSWANNLVPGDTNKGPDIFVHDRTTGATERVSVDSFGVEGNTHRAAPSISGDGSVVAFISFANNLVPGNTNGVLDIFVHDRTTGVTERASVDSSGVEGNAFSNGPSISGDGGAVAFESFANNLVPGDTNLVDDIFVRDRFNGLGANSIYLDGPASSPVQSPLNLSWFTAPSSSPYWLAYSLNNGGSVVLGHSIDLAPQLTVLAAGLSALNGTGSYTSPPVTPAAAGLTVYLEVLAMDAGGLLYDSNVLPVTFN